MIINLGTIISERYEVIEKVGTGGMANVYRAMDHRLNRFVAVKVLKTEYSEDTKFVTKFRQEAQAVACLSHPNIVAVYDVGEENGMYYIVMEYIDGITLKKYIERKGKLSVQEAVGISLQIANGLEAAHNNNIIHRDIKPQNILIAKDGTAKVTDFGIAKAASSNTITANAMGSVHYISPEQARGGFSDEKSDIYSLGVTMYEMLSGTLPFVGESAVAIALAHVQEEPIPLAAVNAMIPKGLSNIVAKCMQKKTELRYLTAADLIADMKMFLQDPSGEYGIIKNLYENSETIFIRPTDVKMIKEASNTSLHGELMEEGPEEEPEVEEKESGVDPKLEKALVIGSIVVAIIIGVIIIYMLGKVIGIWPGGGSDNEPSATEQPKVEATTTPETQNENMVAIPDISAELENATNKSQEAIEVILSNYDLEGKFITEESEVVPENEFIRTEPEAGTMVEKGTIIKVYISSGPHKEKIPNVYGQTLEDAQMMLESAGFEVEVSDPIYSDTVDTGLVVKTSPKKNAEAAPGSKVKIYISKGTEMVEVPNLYGMTKSQASRELKALGLSLGKVTESYSEEYDKKTVMWQSKEDGARVKTGTTIDITISLGSEPTYVNVPIDIYSPFDYDTDPASEFKFVLSQDGNITDIKTVTLGPSDFPYPITGVTSKSGSQGEVIVYRDGVRLNAYSITFTEE